MQRSPCATVERRHEKVFRIPACVDRGTFARSVLCRESRRLQRRAIAGERHEHGAAGALARRLGGPVHRRGRTDLSCRARAARGSERHRCGEQRRLRAALTACHLRSFGARAFVDASADARGDRGGCVRRRAGDRLAGGQPWRNTARRGDGRGDVLAGTDPRRVCAAVLTGGRDRGQRRRRRAARRGTDDLPHRCDE